MQFLTELECRNWMLSEWLNADGKPKLDGSIDQASLDCSFAQTQGLANEFKHDQEVLLWVCPPRSWSANLHLYYRFRESYGDRRLVKDAPGHLFLGYERADLASFLQIVIWNGWDAFVFGRSDYSRLFVSHDGFYQLAVPAEAVSLM